MHTPKKNTTVKARIQFFTVTSRRGLGKLKFSPSSTSKLNAIMIGITAIQKFWSLKIENDEILRKDETLKLIVAWVKLWDTNTTTCGLGDQLLNDNTNMTYWKLISDVQN